MKATVCELTNDMDLLGQQWQALVGHVRQHESDLVLLPEMPFYHWLSHTPSVDTALWEAAVWAHEHWLERLVELSPAVVVGSRPVTLGGKRLNEAYLWDESEGYRRVHHKYYLPDEEEFWEASWYERGDGEFEVVDSTKGRIGFLICTEIWFGAQARAYADQGVQLLLCPRATPTGTADKWVVGGRAAAVVSGAFCLSSNLSGTTRQGGDYAGTGWIIEPESGDVLGLTSADVPFLSLEIDLKAADDAKYTYPRYVLD